jgi:hypothetical protein
MPSVASSAYRGIQIFAGQQVRKQKSAETVKGRAEGHQQPIRQRKTVGGNLSAQPIRDQNRRMSQEEKWRPQNGGADGEQITDMAGARVLIGAGLIVRAQPQFHESKVGVAPILFKSQVALDNGRP